MGPGYSGQCDDINIYARVDRLPLFCYGRDGHQNLIVGVYVRIIRFPHERWDEFIPNKRSLDPGTYVDVHVAVYGNGMNVVMVVYLFRC